jgi:hypothetical protein
MDNGPILDGFVSRQEIGFLVPGPDVEESVRAITGAANCINNEDFQTVVAVLDTEPPSENKFITVTKQYREGKEDYVAERTFPEILNWPEKDFTYEEAELLIQGSLEWPGCKEAGLEGRLISAAKKDLESKGTFYAPSSDAPVLTFKTSSLSPAPDETGSHKVSVSILFDTAAAGKLTPDFIRSLIDAVKKIDPAAKVTAFADNKEPFVALDGDKSPKLFDAIMHAIKEHEIIDTPQQRAISATISEAFIKQSTYYWFSLLDRTIQGRTGLPKDTETIVGIAETLIDRGRFDTCSKEQLDLLERLVERPSVAYDIAAPFHNFEPTDSTNRTGFPKTDNTHAEILLAMFLPFADEVKAAIRNPVINVETTQAPPPRHLPEDHRSLRLPGASSAER